MRVAQCLAAVAEIGAAVVPPNFVCALVAYQSIQIAINSALDGDTIHVAPGTYTGGLRFWGKDIEVVGTGGLSQTVIDGGVLAFSTVRFLDGETQAASLRGFTIRGGEPPTWEGSGVYISNSSPVVAECRIQASSFSYGVWCEGGSPQFTSVEMIGNPTNLTGRSAARFNNATPTLQDCTVMALVNNPSLILDSSDSTLVACSISGGNSGTGGGLQIIGGTAHLSSCSITGNTGTVGGGVNVSQSALLTMHQCAIANNSASNNGGGVWISSFSTLSATECTFSDNTAQTNQPISGSAIFSYGSVSLVDCDFDGNSGASGSNNGSVVYAVGTAQVADCTILGDGPTGSCGTGLTLDDCDGQILRTMIQACSKRGMVIEGDGAFQVQATDLSILQCKDVGLLNNPAQVTVDLTNCTIADCGSGISGSGITGTNCIVWGNTGGGGGLPLTYSDIQNPIVGTGNISADPLFAAPGNFDYSLQPGSPCIDTGDPNSPSDPDGSPADMGARTCSPSIFGYGPGMPNSVGLVAALSAVGEPSVQSAGFAIHVSDAVPDRIGVFFWGNGAASKPFKGGTKLVAPPVKRLGLLQLDASGSANQPITLNTSMVGETRNFQFWHRDLNNPAGTGIALSDALQVTFCE